MVDSFQLLTNDLKGKILTLKINNSDFSKSFFFISINTGQREILLVKFVRGHYYSFWEGIRRE